MADLITRAMNLSEGASAAGAMKYHFACREHGISDGRDPHVLILAGNVIGVVGLLAPAWEPSSDVWLSWFAIGPDYQGQGWGKRLLEYIEDESRRRGYQRILIETYTSPDYARAVRFYELQGYLQAGRVRDYLPDADLLVYMKRL